MSKLGTFLLSGLFMFCVVGAHLPTEASVDVSHLPIVVVKDRKPIEEVLEKPTKEKPFVSKMEWTDRANHNKLKEIYLSAGFNEAMFTKIKDSENLAFEATGLINEAFQNTGIHITPYLNIMKDSYGPRDLVAKLSLYDGGIVISVERQEIGELIFRGFLEYPGTRTVYGSYSAYALYDKNGGYEAKRAVFKKALREFVQEIEKFKYVEKKKG